MNDLIKTPTNDDIASYVDRDKKTISGWRQKQPQLLEIVKLGSFCKKNDLDIEQIKKLVEVKEMLRSQKWNTY